MPPKIASSSSQNRRLNCSPTFTAAAYGTASIAACILGPTSVGIWLSTDSGMVQTHQSALACCGVPGVLPSTYVTVTPLSFCTIRVTLAL
jgi:hypothetical protein